MRSTAKKSSTTTSTTATQEANQPFFAKAGGGNFFTPANHTAVPSVQLKLVMNRPGDKFEQEADKMSDKVIRMPTAPAQKEKLQRQEKNSIQKAELPEEKVQKQEQEKLQQTPADEDRLQRKSNSAPAIGVNTQSAIRNKTTGGQPLSADVRSYMEPRFGADFSNVRIHSDPESARLSNQLSARAFTHQNHIFFSRDQNQPGTSEGKQLLAHELTHTIQQGHAVQRTPQVSTTSTPPHIQRSTLGEVLDWIADKAKHIPGFRMFTIILGVNPINMSKVKRNAANILRALIEFMPGGALITQALDNHGVFNKVANWVEKQIKAFGMVGQMFKNALMKSIGSLGWSDLAPWNWGDVWNRAKRIFTAPIDRLIAFAKGVVNDIIKFVKDAILKPLAAMAQGTRGYDLLKAILGEDPITGEPVPRNANTLIGGFMKLIGREDVWQNIKKGNAVARAWAWFQSAMSGLKRFVRAIPGQIVEVLKSLTWKDVITVVGVFTKVGKAFLSIAGRFMSWAGQQVISLLEIIFTVVAPGAVPYIKKAKGAFKSIIQNPIGFAGNLVHAGKLGFQMFVSRIGHHLKTALIKWIVGPLADAGVYIPTSFSLTEILKLVLSVLGLTWQAIRAKLVKIIPEPVLKGLEKTAGILVTLVKEGPVAAWKQIKAELIELKDSLIAQITEMVTTEVVKAAVVKLVSMLNPVGAFIQAIISIYKTITFFIQKISQIAAVVGSFINSIAAIAAGNVANAAKRVEQTMARTLTVVLAFLANFAGLGNIPEKVVGIIRKIRKPIDKALDKIVAWLGKMLKKLVGKVKAGVKRLLNWWKKKVPVNTSDEQHTLAFEGSSKNAKLVLRSSPEKPSDFLKKAAREKSIDKAKSNQPVATAVSHQNGVQELQTELVKYDENTAPATSGKEADKADSLLVKLDALLRILATHIVSTLNAWGVADALITGLNLPRSKFTLEQKRGIAAQHKKKSELRVSSKGELINVAKGLARRHVVSSYDMSRHYTESLNGKKISEGKLLLEQRGSISDARTPVDDLSQTGIQKAATNRYSKFFGYLRNMFIGDSRENSAIQQHLDEGHPELADQKLEYHVRHVKRAWALDKNMKISRLNED